MRRNRLGAYLAATALWMSSGAMAAEVDRTRNGVVVTPDSGQAKRVRVAVYGDGGGKGTVAQWQQAMGIDWTGNRKSIAEAIPPAYTRYIGGQIMQRLESQAAIQELAA